MNFLYFFVIIILISFLGGYTMKFQEATLLIAKKLLLEDFLLPNNLQDILTPKLQTARNIIFFFLILLNFVLCLFITKWYVGILSIFLILLFTTIFKLFMPKTDSSYFLKIIRNDLIKRLKKYELRKNYDHVKIISFVLKRIETTY